MATKRQEIKAKMSKLQEELEALPHEYLHGTVLFHNARDGECEYSIEFETNEGGTDSFCVSRSAIEVVKDVDE
jgi:hypothetical protein